MLTVMKFGGSILSSESDLRRAAKTVKQRSKRERLVVVASALKGATDSLIAAGCSSLENSRAVEREVAAVREKHIAMLAGIKSDEIRLQAEKKLLRKTAMLERALYGIAYLKELSPRSLDIVQTTGERMSVPLIEAYLLDAGVAAVALSGRKHGIVTNSDYGQGIPLMHETRKRLGKKARKLLHNKVVVFPGFFGSDRKGNIVSFGRGGSDFSAAIVAAALNADALELWKDVDGFMSADPKIVRNAVLLPHLSYDEAEELGYFGAKIMHPKTVLPLRKKGIRIVVKNILKPEKAGTIVSGRKQRHERVIKSIAIKRNIACVTLRSPAFVGQAGVLQKIFSAMADACVSVDLVATSETGVSFTIDEQNMQLARKSVPAIDLSLEEVAFDSSVAMVGMVGEGLKHTPGLAGRVFSCLGKHKINVEMISQGSSEINISFLVKERDLGKAVRALHREVCGGSR